MLTRQQRRTLIDAVARNLPSNPSIAAVEPFVGPVVARQIPTGTVLQVARWIIRQALAQATPEMFIGIVFTTDAGQARMGPLVDLAQALQDDPSSWPGTSGGPEDPDEPPDDPDESPDEPPDEPGEPDDPDEPPDDPRKPLWKHPSVVAALLGLTGVLVVNYWPKPDHKPPVKPNLAVPREVAEDGGVPKLEIDYSGAGDDVGLQEVRLWYRFSRQGQWLPDEAWTGEHGTFDFADLGASGVYYFDAIATDTSGNVSPHPADTNGQQDHPYLRPEDKKDPGKVVEVLSDKPGIDIATQLVAYVSDNQALFERDPLVAAQFQSAIQRSPELVSFEQRRVEPPGLILPSLGPTTLQRLGAIEIPVRFNVIHDGAQGLVPASQIEDQLRVLNQAFAPGGIRFRLEDTTSTENAAWARMAAGSPAETAAKTALQAAPESTLNVYVVNPHSLLGWSSFPESMAEQPRNDGTVISYSTLPGGKAPFDLGHTLIHSAGHWLGLLHTFQGGCDGPGDHVDDTVAHANANYGRPPEGQRNNACDPDQQAPIHNYMNYVDDALSNHFTPGQFRRMKESIAAYRPQLLGDQRGLLTTLPQDLEPAVIGHSAPTP